MAYGYYRTLTIDHTKCGSASSSSFAVLVSISGATSVKLVGSGGRVNNTCTQTGGVGGTIPADLVFSTDSAGSTKLPWEVEYYDGAAGTLIAWVQIPTVSASSDTVFYMAYGDAGVTTQQNTGSYSPANAWNTNYKGVWHFPNGTALTLSDSTGNANNATNHSATAVAGKVDGGMAASGAQYVSVASNSGLNLGAAFTIETWFWTSVDGYIPIVSKDDAASAREWGCWWTDTDKFYIEVGTNGSSLPTVVVSNTAKSKNAWHHVAYIYDGSNISIYVDGASDVTPTAFGGPLFNASQEIDFAKRFTTQSNGQWDEARISNIARSADWILTEFNNQNAPGNIGTPGFLTFGSETAAGGSFQPAWAMGSNRIIGGGNVSL